VFKKHKALFLLDEKKRGQKSAPFFEIPAIYKKSRAISYL